MIFLEGEGGVGFRLSRGGNERERDDFLLKKRECESLGKEE